jgi:membrane associated rhomboid family serine protease
MRRPRLEIPERLQRLPLLSVSIVVLWVMATAVVELLWAPLLRTVEGDLQAAVEFAIRNPVVEVDARLLPAVRAVMPEFESNEMFAFLRRSPAQGGGASPQERFDALAAQAFASLDAHPHRVLGLVPRAPQAHSFIGHLLVHASWTHLLATVLIWLLVAPLLERLWGAGVLAGSVLLLGAAGGAVFFLAHSDADRALLGGSAVVAGLVSAVVVRFRNAEVDFLGWLSPWVKAELQAPAWTLALVWAGYEALLWWTVQGALPGGVDDAVGYAAHAAAVGLGALLPLAYSGLGWEERFGRGVSSVRGRGEEARFDFQRVLNLRARGDHDRAFALLRAEVERSARHRDAVTTFWEMCIERGDPQQAAPRRRGGRGPLARGVGAPGRAGHRSGHAGAPAPGDPARGRTGERAGGAAAGPRSAGEGALCGDRRAAGAPGGAAGPRSRPARGASGAELRRAGRSDPCAAAGAGPGAAVAGGRGRPGGGRDREGRAVSQHLLSRVRPQRLWRGE